MVQSNSLCFLCGKSVGEFNKQHSRLKKHVVRGVIVVCVSKHKTNPLVGVKKVVSWSFKYTTHLQVDHVYHRLVQRDWKIS